MANIQDIHHISVISGDPRETIWFYREVLQLSLVKRTVNFDDPYTYHLYFGNQTGMPGTLITFFAWPSERIGRVGGGQVGRIAFRIPKNTLTYWENRFDRYDVDYQETLLFGQRTLQFTDRHKVALAFVESDEEMATPAIIGLHGAELLSLDPAKTTITLTRDLGIRQLSDTEDAWHFQTAGALHQHLVLPKVTLKKGRFGVGTVHHIAWAVSDRATAVRWRAEFIQKEYEVTAVKDRKYFQSIYFQEPGEIIFELATIGPGFLVDESKETLGSQVMIPSQFANEQEEIRRQLLDLDV